MNQKQIGIILIIVGILLASFIGMMKSREDNAIRLIVEERGSCFLDDGTCLHDDRSLILFIVGWIFSGILILLGIYIAFIDKTQQTLAEHQIKVSSALNEAKKDERFNAFLSGFSEEEQKVLKAIKEQDEIMQSTLRYRIGMSKTTLSLLLKHLEKKGIISRKPSGKTNKIFLRKKF